MKQKKILFIAAASGLGDRIAIIPKLLELKKQWYYISLLCYEPAYFTLFYNIDEPLKIYKQNNLYDEIVWVPRNKFKLIRCILKNLRKFHEAYTPTNTFFSSLLWKLFAKKYTYALANPNDRNNGKYDNIIEATLNQKSAPLFEYKKSLKLEYDNAYKKKFWLDTKKIITLFVSIYNRCIKVDELKKIIEFLDKQWYHIVLIWWDREKRVTEYVDIKKYNIVNLLWKTDFLEVSSILTDAELNISMDGWLMRLGHLMNRNNISIQNISLFIMQAPVDNIHSFNIREYTYPHCTPCNYFWSPEKWEKYRIKSCIFYWTDREWECRYSTTSGHIIQLIKKILPIQ